MRYLENQWNDKDLGLQDVPVLTQVRASEEGVATINATIAAFFSGDAKAKKAAMLGPFDDAGNLKVYGNNIAGTGKARERVSYRDPDNPKTIKYRYEETEATAKHIVAATLCTRDDRGSVETMEGDEVKPFVHLVFEDGSQVDLLAPHVKATKTKKDKD